MKYSLMNELNENYSPVQQILVNRGIKAKDIEHYLKTTDEDIHDPMLLDNIKEGAKLLMQSIKDRKKILIIVDCDADGYTSSASLINYMAKVFPSSIELIRVKLHGGKEHGIEIGWLEEIVADEYGLVICPDASSNDYRQHKFLNERGIDVLVLDHHEAEKVSEHAITINNQLSDYPNKTLSGVGIVYKFCSLLDKITGSTEADKMLDLVALGMIADVMDLREFETKHLISKGLSSIQNPFFKGLVQRQSYSIGDSITPIGVAFYIAPLINATIRVGTQEEKMLMFKGMLDGFAYQQVPSTKRGSKEGDTELLIDQSIRNAVNIKNRQKKARDEGMDAVEKIIHENGLLKNQVLLVEAPKRLDKNLSGLIANQLMSKYQKPILLLRKVVEDDSVTLQGSGRGYDRSELNNLKEFLTDSKMFNYAEGHASAFGCGIDYSKVEDFIDYSNKELADLDFSARYEVDYIYEANDMNSQDILDIGGMKALWGKGVDESFIAIKSIKVTKDNITLMSADRNPTIKIVLPNGISLIKFRATHEEYQSFLTEGFVKIDIIGTCAINEWQGNVSPQILVKEYEVVGKQEYYF